MVPPVGFEPTLPPPEGGALSPELRGLWVGTTIPAGSPADETGESCRGDLAGERRCGGDAATRIGLAGDPRAAVRRDRGGPGRPGGRRCRRPGRRCAGGGRGRAAASAGA